MRAAGIRTLGGPVEEIDLPSPPGLAGDEVLIEVRAAGIANWDDLVRTGSWDVGTNPPMALGVEAAGIVVAAGTAQTRFARGDEVFVHSAPLRYQGAWAERFLAPADHVAAKPPDLEWTVAGVLPVPALTATQVVTALACRIGDDVLVHGASGVTGGLLVAFAAAAGCRVVATSSPRAAERVRQYGATIVIDYHSADWPVAALRASHGRFSAAINAVRGGEGSLLPLLADRGRLATITGEPPQAQRGIQVTDAYVVPDGRALEAAVALLLDRGLSIPIVEINAFDEVASALDAVTHARAQGAYVLDLAAH